MTEDFINAFITGWAVLLIFWTIIIIFILIRKPPKSKLSIKIIIYSYLFFLILLIPLIL